MSTVWWTCDHEYLRECRDALSELKYNVAVGKRYVTRSVLAVADSYTALDRSEEIVPRLRWLIEARPRGRRGVQHVTGLCASKVPELTGNIPNSVM